MLLHFIVRYSGKFLGLLSWDGFFKFYFEETKVINQQHPTVVTIVGGIIWVATRREGVSYLVFLTPAKRWNVMLFFFNKKMYAHVQPEAITRETITHGKHPLIIWAQWTRWNFTNLPTIQVQLEDIRARGVKIHSTSMVEYVYFPVGGYIVKVYRGRDIGARAFALRLRGPGASYPLVYPNSCW